MNTLKYDILSKIQPFSILSKKHSVSENVSRSLGLSMAAVPGSLVSPPRVSLQMAPPAVHSVLLVSNLNPEVRGHAKSQRY